jgi:hypothetical protein
MTTRLQRHRPLTIKVVSDPSKRLAPLQKSLSPIAGISGYVPLDGGNGPGFSCKLAGGGPAADSVPPGDDPYYPFSPLPADDPNVIVMKQRVAAAA